MNIHDRDNSIWHQHKRKVEHRDHHTEICSHCHMWIADTTGKVEKCATLIMIDNDVTLLRHRMGVR